MIRLFHSLCSTGFNRRFRTDPFAVGTFGCAPPSLRFQVPRFPGALKAGRRGWREPASAGAVTAFRGHSQEVPREKLKRNMPLKKTLILKNIKIIGPPFRPPFRAGGSPGTGAPLGGHRPAACRLVRDPAAGRWGGWNERKTSFYGVPLRPFYK